MCLCELACVYLCVCACGESIMSCTCVCVCVCIFVCVVSMKTKKGCIAIIPQALQGQTGGGSTYPGVQVGGTATGAMIFWGAPCNNRADNTILQDHHPNFEALKFLHEMLQKLLIKFGVILYPPLCYNLSLEVCYNKWPCLQDPSHLFFTQTISCMGSKD